MVDTITALRELRRTLEWSSDSASLSQAVALDAAIAAMKPDEPQDAKQCEVCLDEVRFCVHSPVVAWRYRTDTWEAGSYELTDNPKVAEPEAWRTVEPLMLYTEHVRIVDKLKDALQFQAEITKALLPYQDRAVAAETLNTRPAFVIDDATVERAAKAMERANTNYWTDEQFEIWWHQDPHFCVNKTAWSCFDGTRKEKVLWEARNALTAALNLPGEVV